MLPSVNQPAPRFSGIALINGKFKEINLSEYRGKYVLLVFFPLDFTIVCPSEVIAFSNRAEEFRKIGCEVIACSTNSQFCHLAWTNSLPKNGLPGTLNIPLLSDKSAKIAHNYGVLDDKTGIASRAIFIIDPEQILRHITFSDIPIGRRADEVLRIVQAIKYYDEHNDEIPADWKPVDKTLIPDQEKSKKKI